MSKLPVIVAPDDKLMLHSLEVTEINHEIIDLVNDMIETVFDVDGFGLAAVQVGILKRVFVTRIPLEYLDEYSQYQSTGTFTMINPEIIELSNEKIILKEGCLSLPYQYYDIKRPKYLTIRYIDLESKACILQASGWLARCIQHEIDHLNGISYIRHLSKLKYDIAMKKAQRVKDQINISI
ncbi:peptide deformylase [Wolbachia endosymbiont of Howardula sp.]|uniref:peptide deformylase n=1 Tax=Wolbachia endosymbiont of Howardula sp. TaxID=2916816 RepID=UPI00217E9CDC|nr:peptide deformylase [Wolbachia endosymbiont of Howardula sp.]UWI82991.1 peptide deformylase [Wolbachia endosymbiont of Howardula sp.]